MAPNRVLVVNAGSTSHKFRLFNSLHGSLMPYISGLLEIFKTIVTLPSRLQCFHDTRECMLSHLEHLHAQGHRICPA
jgi:acetate kinase